MLYDIFFESFENQVKQFSGIERQSKIVFWLQQKKMKSKMGTYLLQAECDQHKQALR